MTETRSCAHCETPFIPVVASHRYCNPGCRHDAYAERCRLPGPQRARARFLEEQGRINAAWRRDQGIPRKRKHRILHGYEETP